jgi:hypothetical protein
VCGKLRLKSVQNKGKILPAAVFRAGSAGGALTILDPTGDREERAFAQDNRSYERQYQRKAKPGSERAK